MSPTCDELLWMYCNMVTSRRFEETIAKFYFEGKTPVFNMANGPIPGEMPLSDGQEPVAVGVCAHLAPHDVGTATHRPHLQAIAKGVDLDKMAAEIFGKATGLSGGRGGHMPLFDPDVSFACSGIIAPGPGPQAERAVALSRRIETGYTFIDAHGPSEMDNNGPFGGCKKSGIGRNFGYEGVTQFQGHHSIAGGPGMLG